MIYIILGVSGVGKSTIGLALAEQLRQPFLDADDFHPPANVSKMSKGQPLTDEDRGPWLQAINSQLKKIGESTSVVLACSALKETYRKQLIQGVATTVKWIVLHGSQDLILERMQARKHFMPPALLQSQFDAFELPNYGIYIDIVHSPNKIIEEILKKENMALKAEIGLIGLGVMGKSLSRNIANKGFRLSVYNRELKGKEEQVAADFVEAYPELKGVLPFNDLAAFVNSLSRPRNIFLMVNAGAAVDAVIAALMPLLEAGDLIIDGGNSHYKETERRYQSLAENDLEYIGTGVSGGEEGALKGPSIMPGGSAKAYSQVGRILEAIAAKDKMQKPCCAFIGKGGAGHFVKMVHNGIEYAEMQLIAEVYGILRFQLGQTPEEISALFRSWAEKGSASYLLEISSNILLKKEDNTLLLDLILDKAGNKGTGSWTTIAACELGVAIPTITAALFARYQSAQHATRQVAATVYPAQKTSIDLDIDQLHQAYQQARIINHHQGYELMAAASATYGWDINFAELSRIWTNGCIIRSSLMELISVHIGKEKSLLLNSELNANIVKDRLALNSVVSKVSNTGLSLACLSSALSYLNGYSEKQALANFIQAQRDYFGAHTYERKDAPVGTKFHTEW